MSLPINTSSATHAMGPRRVYQRYVAIGDSSTEGLEDPDGNGGYRGWADRLAQHIADDQGSLLYANLAVRGLRTREILNDQLEAALRMKPDLVTLFTGTNDVIGRRFDPTTVRQDVATMQGAFRANGATVLGFTLPDLTTVLPFGRILSGRIAALNDALRAASAETGSILLDFGSNPVAIDLRIWNADRIHVNSLGHARIAAALGSALGLGSVNQTWAEPLPDRDRPGKLEIFRTELDWFARHLLPWIGRRLLGKSSSDGAAAKRPTLEPVMPRNS